MKGIIGFYREADQEIKCAGDSGIECQKDLLLAPDQFAPCGNARAMVGDCVLTRGQIYA